MQKHKATLIPLIHLITRWGAPLILFKYGVMSALIALFIYLNVGRAIAGVAFPIEITVAVNVQAAINQTSTAKRKRINHAISVGNAFMQQHFDGNAYLFDPGYDVWSKRTGPLVAMSGEELKEIWVPWLKNDELMLDGKSAHRYRLTCPQIGLTSLRNDGGVLALTYQATRVGDLIDLSNIRLEAINTDDLGKYYEVHLELSMQNKITKIISQDNIAPYIYTSWRKGINNFLSKPYARTGETQDFVDNEVKILQKILKELDQAAKVCKSISTTS